MHTTSLCFRSMPLAAALAAALCGCTTKDERGDLVVTKMVRPTITSGVGIACELNVTTSELAFGSVDPAVAPTYLLGAVVENRLVSNANSTQGRLNTNDFQVEQARVRYEFPDASFNPSIGEQTTPANGLIKVSGSGAVGVNVFPPGVITILRGALGASVGTVRAKLRLEGKLLDGSSIKTSEYEYTVRVCNGCGTPAPRCVAPTPTPVSCAPGQDSDVACQ